MRLAVLADVHANRLALEAVLADAKELGVDQYVFLGDLVMKGPDPAGVFNLVRGLNPLCWLKGNTDMWLEESGQAAGPVSPQEQELREYLSYAKAKLSPDAAAFLMALPVQKAIDFEGVKILCVHGSPRAVDEAMNQRVSRDNLKQMIKGVKEDMILCGHTHVPFQEVVDGVKIYNGGSVGSPLDGDNKAAYGILDITDGEPVFVVRRVAYSVEGAIGLARGSNFPNPRNYEYSLRHATQA